ncbi:DUF1761 domain-containing protein [Yoonia sp. 208BN28-4]|uniref:DUF1761 domain-containing protein n=1 Tax=Yoonia sp. 208BN28-4 TaxID=3126505 RepID=UPI0030A04D45
MGYLPVILAAIATFAFGAAYYMALSKPWMEASGIKTGPDGKPEGESAVPYAVSLVMILLVAGMMRHTFVLSDIDTVGKGFISGLGIGAFFISPWIFINTGYSMRPWKLAVIDSGYATFGCAVMGTVLMLF